MKDVISKKLLERSMKEGEVYGLTENELSKLLSEAGFETIIKKKSEV